MGPISLKECNGVVLNRLKRIRGLEPPTSPQGHQGAPISTLLGSLICPLRHQRAQMFHCSIKGPISRFSPSGHLAPLLPHCFIKAFQFPHCVIKGPQIFHCAIKGPQFPRHVIKIMTPNFPSCYQGVPIYHCIIKGSPFHHCVIKGTQISKIHHVCN